MPYTDGPEAQQLTPPSPDSPPPEQAENVDPFEAKKERAWQLALEGKLRPSLELLDELLAWARKHGDRPQLDRALCARASVLVELGETSGIKQDLRRVLLGNDDAEVSFLAAYTLSRAYDIETDVEKAVFYARIANRHALAGGSVEQQSSSFNQLGNLMLAQSDFEEAFEYLKKSLALIGPGPSIRRGICLDNLGYCYTIWGRYGKAFGALFEALRILRKNGARALEANTLLSLAFAYLQMGRFDRALRHGRKSLVMAEECEDHMVVKYCLFVLGEAEKLSGNPLAAREHFLRLEKQFYPENPNVSDLLLVLNVQNLINLKA